jgi:hypothetical protein
MEVKDIEIQVLREQLITKNLSEFFTSLHVSSREELVLVDVGSEHRRCNPHVLPKNKLRKIKSSPKKPEERN